MLYVMKTLVFVGKRENFAISVLELGVQIGKFRWIDDKIFCFLLVSDSLSKKSTSFSFMLRFFPFFLNLDFEYLSLEQNEFKHELCNNLILNGSKFTQLYWSVVPPCSFVQLTYT